MLKVQAAVNQRGLCLKAPLTRHPIELPEALPRCCVTKEVQVTVEGTFSEKYKDESKFGSA